MRRAGDVCFSQVYRDRDGEIFSYRTTSFADLVPVNSCFQLKVVNYVSALTILKLSGVGLAVDIFNVLLMGAVLVMYAFI